MAEPKRKILKNVIVILIVLASAAALLFTVYVRDYYRAEITPTELSRQHPSLTYQAENGVLQISQENQTEETGIIFYPGAKVETFAYAPLFSRLAEAGYACFLAEMPFHLAVFDIDAADAIIDQNPQISQWVIAGHSLGGAMAASYAADQTDRVDGMILLAAYGTKDLRGSDLSVLTIYGSEDQVLDHQKLEANKINLGPDARFEVLSGGNHAGFGNYGVQKGDGTASLSTIEQQNQTAALMLDYLRTLLL